MREMFQLFVLVFAVQACQTVQLKSMFFDDHLCKNPETAWQDLLKRKSAEETRQDMERIYNADLKEMPSRELKEWHKDLGPDGNYWTPMGKLSSETRWAALNLRKMKDCINPEAKQMSDRHFAFLEKLGAEIPLAIARENERHEQSIAKATEEERLREAKEAEDFKLACEAEKRYAKKHGLKSTCGTSVSELVYALAQNHAKESEVRKSIVLVGNSDWTEEQSIQALPDMALYSVENGRFTLMIKARGLIQGQTLNDVGKLLVFEGITNYQASFGSRQAFVFSILNPK